MEQTIAKTGRKHSIFWHTLILIIAGLGTNLLFSFLARTFTPDVFSLYLDSIGTVTVTMIGGALPGVIVGFATNLINSLFSSQLTLYYGTISVLIALVTRYLFIKGYFDKPLKRVCSTLVLALVAGGLGSVLTWLVNGFDFGSEISAPLARKILDAWQCPPFLAQFTADMAINLADKLLVVAISLLIFYFFPPVLKRKFPPAFSDSKPNMLSVSKFFHSLLGKVVLIMVAFEVILCVLVAGIGYFLYSDTNIKKYSSTCQSAAAVARNCIDAQKVDAFIADRQKVYDNFIKSRNLPEEVTDAPLDYPESFEGFAEYAASRYSAEYLAVVENLRQVAAAFPDLTYLYVYRVEETVCRVIFDIDDEAYTPFVPVDESFDKLMPTLLAGGEIDPIVTDDTYGWLLTVYLPLRDNAGNCRAYVCVDVSMDELRTDQTVFITKVLTLLIGASLIVLVIVLNVTEKLMVEPINAISDAASRFAYDSEEGQKSSIERIQNLNVHSEDEIERLYNSLKKLATDSTLYIEKIKSDAETITKMQEGIIIDFANMVESRDQNTGDHIKKTSYYVERIAQELRTEGLYTDVLTDDYIEKIVRSAPLHDVGKIKISDLLLNKPGRLTDEEFALMKTHTTAGHDILTNAMVNTDNTDYLKEAIDMAYYHHEWWNGKGYPCGLSGEQIPLSARIMAVADVFDALVSRRSYKEPFPFDKAVGIIKEESGTHFDPNVAQAFINIADSLKEQL